MKPRPSADPVPLVYHREHGVYRCISPAWRGADGIGDTRAEARRALYATIAAQARNLSREPASQRVEVSANVLDDLVQAVAQIEACMVFTLDATGSPSRSRRRP